MGIILKWSVRPNPNKPFIHLICFDEALTDENIWICMRATDLNFQGFKVVLENVQDCKEPNPPYAKKFTLKNQYNINDENGMQYLSGNMTVIAPIPFLNFSGRTYAVDKTGERVVKLQVSQVSCRNLIAKAIIMFSNMKVSAKSCMLQKGVFCFNLDINKIMHSLPSWHAPGKVIHELQLVVHGATEACTEVYVTIK